MAADQAIIRDGRIKFLLDEAVKAIDSESQARACYLTVQGFNGTQTLGPVSNGFRVYAESWSAMNSGFSGGATSGGGAAFQDLYVVMDLDSNLPSFLTAMAAPNVGSPIQQAVVYYLQQDSSAIGNITLATGFITDLGTYFIKSKQNRPLVVMGLSYQQITIKVGTSQGSYNIAKGSKG